jgi:hypothetical protein
MRTIAISMLLLLGACERKPPGSQADSAATRGTAPVATATPDISATRIATPTDSQPAPSTHPATLVAETQPSPIPSWHPLLRAAAGDWVEYESLERMRIRYDVLKITPTGVLTRVTTHQEGRTWGKPATREDDLQFDPLQVQAERGKATRTCQPAVVEIADAKWECILYEDRWTDEDIPYVRRTWVSAAAPFLGTVRMELHGADRLEARLTMMAWSKSPAAPTPR